MASSERVSGFWRSLFERYQALGALRWSELRLDGSLVAFCLALAHGSRLYAMKTSYDERYAYYSPGHILRDAIVERCVELDVEALELLGPTRRWKERYATETRETIGLRAYRRDRSAPPGTPAGAGSCLACVRLRRAPAKASRRSGDVAERPSSSYLIPRSSRPACRPRERVIDSCSAWPGTA